jgi:integrase
MAQVFDLADAMPGRYRALVLLAAFDSLRWGEATALVRSDIGPDARTVRVSKALVEVPGLALVAGSPKSRAGNRVLAIPEAIRPDIVAHLDTYVGTGTNAYVFTGEKGNPLRRPNFNQRVSWTKVVADMGLTGLHFHDLRHAGNTWA